MTRNLFLHFLNRDTRDIVRLHWFPFAVSNRDWMKVQGQVRQVSLFQIKSTLAHSLQ
jgi:hypothetical protein